MAMAFLEGRFEDGDTIRVEAAMDGDGLGFARTGEPMLSPAEAEPASG